MQIDSSIIKTFQAIEKVASLFAPPCKTDVERSIAKLKMQTMIGEADRFGLKPHIVLSFGNSDDLIKKLFFDHFTKVIGQSVGF